MAFAPTGVASLSLSLFLGCATSSTGGADTSSSSSSPPSSSTDGADACTGIDLASDPKHCGACNHDCFGGLCREGRCAEALVYEGSQRCNIAAGDGSLWIGDGERGILKLPVRETGTPQPVVPPATDLERPDYVLRYGADALYWNVLGGRDGEVPPNRKIFRTGSDGTTRAVVSLADGTVGGSDTQLATAFGVTANDVYLYRPSAIAPSVFMRVALVGGRATDVVTVGRGVESLATHGERVAFLDVEGGGSSARIGVIDGPGKAPRYFRPQQRKDEKRSALVAALDDAAVYALQPAALVEYQWALRRVPLSGEPTSVVLQSEAEITKAVVDATRAYATISLPRTFATDPSRTRVVAADKNGSGAPTTLFEVDGFPVQVVHDGMSVVVLVRDAVAETSRIYRLRVAQD